MKTATAFAVWCCWPRQRWLKCAANPVRSFDYPTPKGMNSVRCRVAVNSKGHVFVFTRSNSATGSAFAPAAAQLLEFDAHGNMSADRQRQLRLVVAHTVRIDKNDNIWAVDKGSDMIVKFKPAGRIQWVSAAAGMADSTPAPGHPDPPPPTSTACSGSRLTSPSTWATHITDGYINPRVAKIDAKGNWVKSWAGGTGEGQFRTPHRRDRQNDNVYVGDRANRRVQVFDRGQVLAHVHRRRAAGAGHRGHQRQHPDGRSAGAGDRRLNSFARRRAKTCCPRRVDLPWTRLNHARRQGARRDRKVRPQPQGIFRRPPARLPSNEIYVAESSNWRVQKLLLADDELIRNVGRISRRRNPSAAYLHRLSRRITLR